MNNEIAYIKKMKNIMKYKFYICDNQLHSYMCIYVGYSSCSITIPIILSSPPLLGGMFI